jgi:hypothetical protein
MYLATQTLVSDVALVSAEAEVEEYILLEKKIQQTQE